jgi:predicted transcriptional regulator
MSPSPPASSDLKLSSDEARRIARFELARYAAHALMMPYQAFHAAAQRARYDIDVLKSRFGVSFEQAANRVTTLCRPIFQGVPFFMLEVDVAGHRFRRAGAQGFPQQRFGGNCPKLSVHAAFSQPAQVLVEAVEMPGGAEFITISRTLEGPQGSFSERPRRTAILLGCDIGFRDEIVYGEALPITGGKTAAPGFHPGWSGLPPVRTLGLSRPGRTADHPAARARRDGDRPVRLRFPVHRPGSVPSGRLGCAATQLRA